MNFSKWIALRVFKIEDHSDRIVDLEAQVQSLRLDLADKAKECVQARVQLEELDRTRMGDRNRAAQNQTEKILSDLATPMVHLLTALEQFKTSTPQSLSNLELIIRQLFRALEAHGASLIGAVGECTPYDPSVHAPLSQETSPAFGDSVQIKIPGLRFGDKVIRKAGI